jgi:hypothetical protein
LGSQTEAIVTSLLKKASDSNSFMQQAVNMALRAAGKFLPVQPLINQLPNHFKNKTVQCKLSTLYLAEQLANRRAAIGPEQWDKLCRFVQEALGEGALTVRRKAK